MTKPRQIIIAGRRDSAETAALLKMVHARFLPNKIILLADGDSGRKTLESMLPFIKEMRHIEGTSTAYVCENYACQLPVTDPQQLARLLDA
jgi:uncharacterized protein YyaL (SSP411 family)